MKAIVAMIVFCGLVVISDSSRAQTWTPTSANTNYAWYKVALSADGTKLAALGSGGLYLSTNSGATWAPDTSAPSSAGSVASSADGNTIVVIAVQTIDYAFSSTNGGSTWNQSPSYPWSQNVVGPVSAADGKRMVLTINGGGIYTSTNSGITWLLATNVTVGGWALPVCSANGSEMAALGAHGIYLSTNSGSIWRLAPPPFSGQDQGGLVCSEDGSILVDEGFSPSYMYFSTNWGLAWIRTNTTVDPSAISVGGSLMLGIASSSIYTSTNFGASWISNSLPFKAWDYIACSADGNELVALAGTTAANNPSTNGIWIAQTTPSPQLNLTSSGANLNFSWLVPSTNMALEESLDLMNWTISTNAPSLNYTNLQEQLSLSQTSGNGFFRLVSQ